MTTHLPSAPNNLSSPLQDIKEEEHTLIAPILTDNTTLDLMKGSDTNNMLDDDNNDDDNINSSMEAITPETDDTTINNISTLHPHHQHHLTLDSVQDAINETQKLNNNEEFGLLPPLPNTIENVSITQSSEQHFDTRQMSNEDNTASQNNIEMFEGQADLIASSPQLLRENVMRSQSISTFSREPSIHRTTEINTHPNNHLDQIVANEEDEQISSNLDINYFNMDNHPITNNLRKFSISTTDITGHSQSINNLDQIQLHIHNSTTPKEQHLLLNNSNTSNVNGGGNNNNNSLAFKTRPHANTFHNILSPPNLASFKKSLDESNLKVMSSGSASSPSSNTNLHSKSDSISSTDDSNNPNNQKANNSSNTIKRVPLLRRASSVLRKKTSINRKPKNKLPDSSNVDSNESNNSGVNNFITPRQRNLSNGSDYTKHSIIESHNDNILGYKNNKPPSSKRSENNGSPSFGSKVKRSISRIISTSKTSSNTVPTQNSTTISENSIKLAINSRSSSTSSTTKKHQSFSSGTPSPSTPNINTNYFSKFSHSGNNHLVNHSSLPTESSQPKTFSHLMTNFDRDNEFDNQLSIISSLENLKALDSPTTTLQRNITNNENTTIENNLEVIASEEQLENSKYHDDLRRILEGDKIFVDLSKITGNIPLITITDGINGRNENFLHTQSNLQYDDIFQSNPTSKHKENSESSNLHSMTLKEYIQLLINQQHVEDQRFAKLEPFFSESGWCSDKDLNILKQKRILMNKKWAERISYYQSCMDS